MKIYRPIIIHTDKTTVVYKLNVWNRKELPLEHQFGRHSSLNWLVNNALMTGYVTVMSTCAQKVMMSQLKGMAMATEIGTVTIHTAQTVECFQHFYSSKFNCIPLLMMLNPAWGPICFYIFNSILPSLFVTVFFSSYCIWAVSLSDSFS